MRQSAQALVIIIQLVRKGSCCSCRLWATYWMAASVEVGMLQFFQVFGQIQWACVFCDDTVCNVYLFFLFFISFELMRNAFSFFSFVRYKFDNVFYCVGAHVQDGRTALEIAKNFGRHEVVRLIEVRLPRIRTAIAPIVWSHHVFSYSMICDAISSLCILFRILTYDWLAWQCVNSHLVYHLFFHLCWSVERARVCDGKATRPSGSQKECLQHPMM